MKNLSLLFLLFTFSTAIAIPPSNQGPRTHRHKYAIGEHRPSDRLNRALFENLDLFVDLLSHTTGLLSATREKPQWKRFTPRKDRLRMRHGFPLNNRSIQFSTLYLRGSLKYRGGVVKRWQS